MSRPMPGKPRTLLATAFAALPVLAAMVACSPAYNWREVRPENSRLLVLFPCKPEKAEKMVPLGGPLTNLTLLGCDAGGATFAVATADIGDTAKVPAVLEQWQNLTLSNMQAPPVAAHTATAAGGAPLALATNVLPTQKTLLKVAGADLVSPAVLLKARGSRADGSDVTGQAAYFARGSNVFQVVVYADKLAPEVSDTFFSSLKFE